MCADILLLGLRDERQDKQTTCDGYPHTLWLPDDLVSFARACVANEDITECLKLALHRLRRDIEHLARDLDSAH